MKNLVGKNTIITIILAVMLIFAAIPLFIYVKVLPDAVSNEKVLEKIEKLAKSNLDADLTVKKPVLKTGFSPEISFKTDEISITKDKNQIFSIKNLDTTVSLQKLLQKTVILKKIEVDSVFVDANKLLALFSTENQPQNDKKSDWNVQWLESLLSVKNLLVLYDAGNNTNVKIVGKNLEITKTRNPKFVHFDLNIDVSKNKKNLHFALKDEGKVFINNKKIYLNGAILGINRSKVFINAESDEKSRFSLDVYSHNFDVENVIEILSTNLVIPNSEELLAYYKDIKGVVNFNINLTNNSLNGLVNVKNASLKLVPLNNMPVFASKGNVDITEKDIVLRDFEGYYGKTKNNSYKFAGTVNDYTNSVEMNIEATGKITNDFMKNYLSPVVGVPLTLTGISGAKAIIKSKYNKFDIALMGKIAKGDDILVDGASLSPIGYDRAFAANLNLVGNNLDIKSIDYYIAQELTKASKGVEPILTIDGNVDIATLEVKKLGFNIPKPLPSEFLNVLVGQKIFKKGTISGKMHMICKNKIPKLDGNLKMEKVRIPSQRLFIKQGTMFTDKNLINIVANGRFKKSKWKFGGNIENSLLLPIVVKNINLHLDNVDAEKILASMVQQPAEPAKNAENQKTDEKTFVNAVAEDENDDDSDEAPYVFDTGLLVIEKCLFELEKGKYKEINFGNIKADLTLDKNGILEIKSNKFDFAEGISSLKVYCDLIKHKYSIRLGVKDVNSDLIATTILALPKEISGKGKGLIELNTDDSLKLNGKIQFEIQNGAIQKVGLVEYALKFASLFRNPMTMISPSTIFDLVNVPDGSFNWIKGNIRLKDNVAMLMIKSAAPQLSSFIVGGYNIENSDAALRIYTKFSGKHKGLSGVLRNISLNSLANKVSLGSTNESLYYSAELSQLPPLEAEEKDCQVFLTKVDGDVEHFNFLSSLKKIK